MDLSYLTNQFIRSEVGIYGAEITDDECELIRAQVQRLHKQGEFHHTGVYWIVNRLAADGIIHSKLAKEFSHQGFSSMS